MKANVNAVWHSWTTRSTRSLDVALGLLILLGLAPSVWAGDVTIETIRVAWQSRETKMNQSAFRLDWTETIIDSALTDQPNISRSEGSWAPHNLASRTMIFKSEKLRYERAGLELNPRTNEKEPMTMTFAWKGTDGKGLTYYGPGASRNTGQIWDTHKRFVDLTIRIPCLALSPTKPRFAEVDLSQYQLLPERKMVSGALCHVLRRKDGGPIETEIFVNPAYGFLIQRIVGKQGDKVERQIDYKYETVKDLGWMPCGWQLVMMKPESEKVSYRLLASEAKASLIDEPSDSTFDIVFPAGTIVHKPRENMDTERFVVDQDGNLIPKSPNRGGQTENDHRQKNTKNGWLFVSVIVTGVALIVLGLFRRNLRKK